jgi:hypothetical protein
MAALLVDNGVSEAFNSTLEFELLSRQRFTTRQQARRAVAARIDEYTIDRRHSTNGMLSPVDYERTQATEPDNTPATTKHHRADLDMRADRVDVLDDLTMRPCSAGGGEHGVGERIG